MSDILDQHIQFWTSEGCGVSLPKKWRWCFFPCLSCQLFFFQAVDGIRDPVVTGVQTCALPIWGVDVVPRLGDAVPIVLPRRRIPRVAAGVDRKSVVEGKSVDLGGRRMIKK